MIDVDLHFIQKHSQLGSPKVRGVYFLFRKKELIYIGSSVDVTTRLKDHRRYSAFKFDRHYVHLVPEGTHLIYQERQMIKKFKPKYNAMYNPDYENGVNRPWFTFILHWKSYASVAKECGVHPGSVKRVLEGNPNSKDDVELITNTILTREKISVSCKMYDHKRKL